MKYNKGTMRSMIGRINIYGSIEVENHWWDENKKIWFHNSELLHNENEHHRFSSVDDANVRSLKAFNRYMRKHSYIGKGYKFKLISNFTNIKNIDKLN